MKFSAPTLVALFAAPSAVEAYSGRWVPLVIQTSSSVANRQRALANRMFEQTDRMLQQNSASKSSPRYEVIDNDDKFQLSMDVPGVKPEDMTISLEDGYLTISGERVTSNQNSQFASKFSQAFSLDRTVDVDSFSANLNNGVLVVSAPKDLKKLEENIRKIPISVAPPEEEVVQLGEASEDVVEEAVSKIDDEVVAEKLPKELKTEASDEEVVNLDKADDA